MSGYLQKPGSGGGGGVESLNALTGALNLVEGAGIDITTAGSDITIAAIGANVSNDTSLAVKSFLQQQHYQVHLPIIMVQQVLVQHLLVHLTEQQELLTV